MIKTLYKFIRNLRYKNKTSVNNTIESEFTSPEDIIIKSDSSIYEKEDLIYFPNLSIYGAFKYSVVRDILLNSKEITVSEIHRDLNKVYFSLDEQQHQQNKKVSYKYLDFLSKKNQNLPNEFTEELFEKLKSKFPINREFNLEKYLIQPLVFINILKEYGFLEYMPSYNPWCKQYKHSEVVQQISDYFEDSSLLKGLMIKYFENGNPIPKLMESFINDIQSDVEINDELRVDFFSSMIFSGTHSTTSFLTSFVYQLFVNYPKLLQQPLEFDKLKDLENEVLRIYMPVQYIYRTVRKDVVYKNNSLKVGDTIVLFIGKANLDLNEFENPETIQFNRKVNHLSFGIGPYACIGKFTTHRMAVNLVSYLVPYSNRFEIVDKNAKYFIHNAILRLPLNVIYNPIKIS